MVKISPRLEKVSLFVRTGSVVWDVGTDHCLLPLYLLQNNICEKVIASDINVGPIEKAKENIAPYEEKSKITLICEDGLASVEKYKPNDILICGMGGELIRDIIDACPYTKNEKIHLILQPMTRCEILREYLSQNGYEIKEEILVEDGKIYEVLSVYYTNIKRELSISEKYFGSSQESDLYKKYLKTKREHILKRAIGLESSSQDSSIERELIKYIDEFLKR